jgi:hypothetical protein
MDRKRLYLYPIRWCLFALQRPPEFSYSVAHQILALQTSILCIPPEVWHTKCIGTKVFDPGWCAVYDIKLVRALCETIAIEQDNEKTKDMLDLLRSVMRGNDEEMTLRLDFLKKKYALH